MAKAALPDPPKCLDRAIDALAHWVQYQNIRYFSRIQTEGSLQDELAALLEGFARDMDVHREVPVDKALPSSKGNGGRFDIVLTAHTPGKRGAFNPADVKCVIEIKRGQNTQTTDAKNFEDDLKRIADESVKDATVKKLALMVVVVYQSCHPPARLLKKFAKGKTARSAQAATIWGTKKHLKTAGGITYRVRRTACARRNSTASATSIFVLQPVL